MSDVHPSQHQGLAPLDEPGDAELISAVRGGDLDAYGTLFARHVEAARRLARQLVSAGDVDDLVSDAFAKVLAVLQRGGGPDLAFRAYLLTSLRRLHVDRLRAGARLTTTDDMAAYDPGVPFEDTAVSGFDNAAAAKAFASLPERWQQVLWHTEVEGQKPAEIAPLLGISANSVSALAYRAREGLRQAFISMHAQDAVEDACVTTRGQLGAYLRGGTSRRDGAKVEEHLGSCRECSAIYLELTEVNNDLGAVLAPLVLGSAGTAYLAAAHVGTIAAAKGGVLFLFGRTRDWLLHDPIGRVAAGATGVVAAGVVVAAVAAHGGSEPVADRHPAAAVRPAGKPAPAAPAGSADRPTTPGTHAKRTAPATPTGARPAGQPVASPRPAPTSSSPAKQPATSSSPVIRTPLADVSAARGGSPVTIDLTKGAVDPDGGPLTVKSAKVVAPRHGKVALDRASARAVAGRRLVDLVTMPAPRAPAGPTTVTYTPDPGWRGTDTIRYVLTNGHGGTAAGTVRVRTPNTAPVAHDDAAHAAASWLAGTPTRVDVLANDTDANHDRLTIRSVTAPAHGRATVAGGAISYTPGDAFLGTDSFRYTIGDGHGGTATGTVHVSVGALPNRAPSAHDAAVSTPYGHSTTIDLGEHASDADGDALTFSAGAGPSHGELTVASDGTAVYTPATGYDGTDSFGYDVSDGHGGTAHGTVRVTVQQPVGDLSLTSRHDPTIGYLGSHLVVDGIASGRHATVTITVLGFLGWQNDTAGVCGTDWVVDGTTATLTCTVDSTDNGRELGHYDPRAAAMSARATADDFSSPDAGWAYP